MGTNEPARSGLAAEIIARNAREGEKQQEKVTLETLESQLLTGESFGDRIMRDPLFAAHFALVDCSDEVISRTEFATQFECRAIEAERQVAELERREALLKGVAAHLLRWEEHVYGVGNAEDWYETAMDYVSEMAPDAKALRDAGFPWGEGGAA